MCGIRLHILTRLVCKRTEVQEALVYDACWVSANPPKVTISSWCGIIWEVGSILKATWEQDVGRGWGGSTVSGLNLVKYGPQTGLQSPASLGVWGWQGGENAVVHCQVATGGDASLQKWQVHGFHLKPTQGNWEIHPADKPVTFLYCYFQCTKL